MPHPEPALLVVDMQRVFAEPTSPWAVPGFDAALTSVLSLLEHHADRGVLTRFVPHSEPRGSWVDYYDAYPFAADPASGPLWELAPPLAGLDVATLDAPTMGKWTPDVVAALGRPETVLLAGVATECCVLATAIAASDAGVRVRLVADACAGGTLEDHDRTLAITAAFAPQIQVVTLDEALDG